MSERLEAMREAIAARASYGAPILPGFAAAQARQGSGTALVLRDYQREAVEAIWNGLVEAAGNLLCVLPTGTGKSIVIAEFIRRVVSEYPECRILVVTHVQELVEQNFKEMVNHWPQCPAGIYSAGLNSRDVKSQVIFAGIQSIHNKAFKLQKVDIILVDEAQSIPRKSDTTWLKFLHEVKLINPYLRVVGLTATAFRMDSGMLHKGKGALFERIVYEYNILDAIGSGYLCAPISKSSETQIDTSGVGVRGGEFIATELNSRACDPDTVKAIVRELMEAGQDRKGWIVFGAGVEHCEMIRQELKANGVTCEGVFATTPKAERRAHVENFKAQKIRCLVSVNALAVGFNAKHVDLVGLARPTKSAGLYIQSCGRGLRLFPGKDNALILDWGGNIKRHGLLDKPNVKDKRGEGSGDIPVKSCPECGADNYIAARECKECGAIFDFDGSKISTRADDGPLLSTQMIQPEWIDVKDTKYYPHVKEGKPPMIRVVYQCGFTFPTEYICLEHVGYARQKAESWWKSRSTLASASVPRSVDEALTRLGELRKPTAIQVRKSARNEKFVDIYGAKFD